jgi:hypothetical protein
VIRCGAVVLVAFAAGGCARPAEHARLTVPSVNITAGRMYDSYEPVPPPAAAILGCTVSPSLPVCEVTQPDDSESAAFREEGYRLLAHSESRCRNLGGAIVSHMDEVRMYRKALVKESGNGRLYGVGHTYVLDSTWLVRVARRIDDLNERTIEEKKRTLRHEMSHTLGASESRESGWSAEDYASICS